jgi:diguanylate cyclase (GGDEF)-like protein
MTADPLALAMLDIDHFKAFNDRYGHEQGDRVLQAVAATLREVARDSDLACRYGGEEFMLILPHTPLDGAVRCAERLRTAIAECDVDGLGVTVSIGVACFDGMAGPADDLVEVADRRLYLAKRGGRNRVVAADLDPPHGAAG